MNYVTYMQNLIINYMITHNIISFENHFKVDFEKEKNMKIQCFSSILDIYNEFNQLGEEIDKKLI